METIRKSGVKAGTGQWRTSVDAAIRANKSRRRRPENCSEDRYGFAELSTAADALAKTLTGTVAWASVEEGMAGLSYVSHRIRETSE